jgi:hypothetical protein
MVLRAATGVLLVVCTFALCWSTAWALVVRRRLTGNPAVFRCVVRVDRGEVGRLRARPRATRCRAQWVHDVLLLHRGTWWPQTQAIAVRTTRDSIRLALPTDHARCGATAVLLELCLDDGAHITVTAPADRAELLAGPFLAMAAGVTPSGAPRPRQP